MKRNSKPCSPPWRCRGLTLVEVLAALVIMSTLLAGMVMAKSRHTRQISLTKQRLVAVRLADALIGKWWDSPGGVPINQQGALNDNWVWDTHLEENSAIEELGARVVRVEVRPSMMQQQRGPMDGEPVVRVDLVVPDPQKQRVDRLAPDTQPGGE